MNSSQLRLEFPSRRDSGAPRNIRTTPLASQLGLLPGLRRSTWPEHVQSGRVFVFAESGWSPDLRCSIYFLSFFSCSFWEGSRFH